MRICVLHNHFYRSSGSAIVIRRIFEAYPAHAAEFSFIGCGHSQPHAHMTEEDLDWIPKDSYRQFRLMSLGPDVLPEIGRFAAWLKRNKFSLVHTHHRRLAAIAHAVSPYTGVPVLYTAHNIFRRALWFKLLAPRWTTGVSPSVVAYLRRSTSSLSPSLIWNPYRFEETSLSNRHPNPAVAMAVGRLEPVKGHWQLIQAWEILRNRGIDARLDIFGEGYLRAELEREVAARKLQDRIDFKGYRSNLEREYAGHAFNLLGSRHEGFPNTVVEAAAQGVPTLLTDVDGSRDTLPPNLALPNGVPFGDVVRLADALALWFQAPEKVAADGLRFYQHLSKLCAPQEVVRQYASTYAEICRQETGEWVEVA
jgi:glycosyltransferase involved in cell wall biosynthesis